jgi:hypothetical protein
MAQFDGGKYNKKNKVLSYNYLGEGEAGAGRGSVFIKKDGKDWYFVDQNGKVRTDVGIEGKLTPTHINNLEKDGIFKSAKINSDGEKLSKAEIKAGVSASGDDIDSTETRISQSGELSDNTVPLANRNNLRLRDAKGTTAPSLSSPDKGGSIDYKKTLERRGTVPAPAVANPSGYGDYKVPPEVPSEAYAGPGTSIWSPGAGELSVRGTSTQGNMPMNYSSGGDWSQSSSSGTPTPTQYDNSGYTFPTGEGPGQMSLRPDRNRVSSDFESVSGGGGALPTQNTMENMSGQPSYSSFQRSFSSDPALNTGTLEIGEGGEGVTQWGGDDDFYRTKDGTLMKDGGWFSGDTEATQADIDAGVTNQNASPWGSAAGWQAAGSVMKGVGGLASAYTGFKNYELARDAHDTQKAQWQANYTQRLKAYEDNKKLANEEIAAKNRVLASRGQEKSYNTI